MAKYRFSPSQLSVFKDSPLDFWLDRNHKCPRPRGIFPSLPGGMDGIIKTYFDTHRAAGTTPPELDCPGVKLYADQAQLDTWRNWRSGIEVEIQEANAKLGGAFDDLLVTEDGLMVPFDYKTKGSPTTEDDTIRYYQHQVDCYGLMLKLAGYPVADFAVFSYWSPDRCMGMSKKENYATLGAVAFQVQTIRIPIDPENARDMVIRAAACLDSKRPPEADASEYGIYYNKRRQIMSQFA